MPAPRSSPPRRSVALGLLATLLAAAGVGARAAPTEPGPGLDSRFVGAFLDAGTFRSPAGVGALGDLGVRSFGIRGTSDRRWLALWDGFLSARGGYVANTRPGARLLGARGLADLEIGNRFPPGPWSGYAGAEGRLDVQALRAVLSSRLPANELDGVTGLNTSARLRLDAGASCLGDGRSLLVVAFVQRARHPTASLGSSELYTEGGLALRWDLAWLATASLEASWGRSGLKRDVALARTDETTHREVSATVWARLPHGPWLGVAGNASQESDRLVYTTSGTTFRTASSPTMGLTFSVGVPVGRAGE